MWLAGATYVDQTKPAARPQISNSERIVTLLAAPSLVAVGILASVFSWNEFSVAVNLTATQTATV
jgi:ABC-type spermidine/putrescine transport system permease subunit II